MDLWVGKLVLPDGTLLRDITLAAGQPTTALTLPSTLRFLSLVDTVRIPLYLAAGPSLDVWTTSADTEGWFRSILLGEGASKVDSSTDQNAHEWWTSKRTQSPVGIIVQIDNSETTASLPRVTEILFYGTIGAPSQAGLPTPPTSSPDSYISTEDLLELRVHALPLSSDLLFKPFATTAPIISPPATNEDASLVLDEVDAQFLPPPFPRTNSPGPGKRKHVDDIFDEAAEQRRKTRRKGGEGIAAAASKIHGSRPGSSHPKSLSVDNGASQAPEVLDSKTATHISQFQPVGRPLSRSPSISSDIRPLSRKGLLEGLGKRSSLSRVTSIATATEELTTESRNKEALSRVVMAGMRMYGLQQRKRPNKSTRGSVAPSADSNEAGEEQIADDMAKDEEYKMIYHQTFKGAVLALRNHIAILPLHSQPDRLRDVVDKLLAIFCTDPLNIALPMNDSKDIQSTVSNSTTLCAPDDSYPQSSPFDSAKSPSSRLLVQGGRDIYINSPKTRRGNVEAG
ncbi:hypothetical protein K432DRAFT_401000 [Lepidopterella palustris CBS 459.81]|uniref:Sld7 C-terminal domain-containing protein n=1 Tax=Lepidopterella palustris CBS 459.81 TaxID=1314670 RepID=A0A8E2EIE0_9PEZI|nr:hypothetical protein K432DRAFT_401000 [Lepidopterella palustris CBS 459.81]